MEAAIVEARELMGAQEQTDSLVPHFLLYDICINLFLVSAFAVLSLYRGYSQDVRLAQ